jgi:regulatory protein
MTAMGVQIPARSWHKQGMTIDNSGDERGRRPQQRREPRVLKPIDAAQLQDMAVGYAAKYATTAAKLRRYLMRKLGERGWSGAELPDVEGLVARICGLGYVDDRAYAAAKVRDLTARGFGTRRVKGALAAAGVGRDDVQAAVDAGENADEVAFLTALAFARRRRFGPFARDGARDDPAKLRREMAAMARAGHDFAVAKRVLGGNGEEFEGD